MSALPPFPGGYSSYATAANNRGEVVGWAENGVRDASCDPAFQVLQFRAAVWHPDGTMQELPPLPGDSTSAATAINDRGQVVGISGDCGIAVGSVSAKHAVMWDHGVPMDLGNIGGDAWNTPTAINNRGVVVGFANVAPGVDRTFEAFIWTRTTGMKSLGKLPGDLRSEATGINDAGEVVGLSRGGPYLFRAVVWRHRKLIDLNTLTASGSPFLLIAGDINDDGTIVGQAFHPDTQASPAFMATPRSDQESEHSDALNGLSIAESQTILPQALQRQLERREHAAENDNGAAGCVRGSHATPSCGAGATRYYLVGSLACYLGNL
jgi:probable HAF family extracellular repeat protein